MHVLSTSLGKLFALVAASTCMLQVSATCVAAPGDQQFGIQQIQDNSCNPATATSPPSFGGVGCIANSACRFCKLWDTMQSQSFVNCVTLQPSYQIPAGVTVPATTPSPSPTLTQPPCTSSATADERSFGINLVTDSTCSSGGLGCKSTVCRYCKDVDTPKSTFLYNCTNVLNPSAPAEPVPSNCTAQVSSGDLAAGVTAVRDESCSVAGGVGCFKSVCRYCKTSDTDLSANFLPCANFQYEPEEYSSAFVTFYWFLFSGQAWTFPVTQSQRCYSSCAPDPWSIVWSGIPTTADPSVNNGRSQIVFYQSSDCSGDGNVITVGDYAFPTINNMTNIGSVASFMIQESSLAATSSETLTCAALQYW